jgi:hypothetical protein
MDKDLSTTYAVLSALFGFLFGVEIGIFWCALAGSLASLRFCEPKSTFEQFKHVGISVVLTCIVVGGTSQIQIDGTKSIYPAWLSLKAVAVIYGFLILLLAEKLYQGVRDTNLTAKLNVVIDRMIDKWTR